MLSWRLFYRAQSASLEEPASETCVELAAAALDSFVMTKGLAGWSGSGSVMGCDVMRSAKHVQYTAKLRSFAQQ